MTYFYEIDSVSQMLLLIISQFIVITLAGGIVFLFKRRCKSYKLFGMCSLLFLNIILYMLMQLDSWDIGLERDLRLCVPYMLLFFVNIVSVVFFVGMVLSETKKRKTLNHISIKESFDNLPTGVVFFNEVGLPVLCNLAMHRFSFAVCGKDVQFITDLEKCFSEKFIPENEIKKDGMVFSLENGNAWQLEKRFFCHKSGDIYTQYIATDVTELHEKRMELIKETEQLRHVQEDLKKLSANVMTVTREEEILNTKMRVHDEMGRCLVAAQKYLKEDSGENIPDSIAISWQRAVSMIKYNNNTPDENMLAQICKTCEFLKVSFIKTGQLPEQEDIAYLLTCAVRECVTNAVRYAEATQLYAEFRETTNYATVIVTNDGKSPKSEIVEGGGLSTLRRRVEYAGGMMNVQSLPYFKLVVTIPKRKEDVVV